MLKHSNSYQKARKTHILMRFSFCEEAVDPMLDTKLVTNKFHFFVRPQLDRTTESIQIFFEVSLKNGDPLPLFYLKRFEVFLVQRPNPLSVKEVITEVRGKKRTFLKLPSFDRSELSFLYHGLSVRLEIPYLFNSLSFCAYQQENHSRECVSIHKSNVCVTSPQDHLDKMRCMLNQIRSKLGECSYVDLLKENFDALGMRFGAEEYINPNEELENK